MLWKKVGKRRDATDAHFLKMQEVITEKIASGKVGLEIGCGDGLDTRVMASRNINTEIIAIDISESVYAAVDLNKGLKNIHLLRSTALELPFRAGIFDFCYSFGVIHHTSDPSRCFKEIHRVLKGGKKVFLYLYEDHADNPFKIYPLKVVTAIRKTTCRLNNKVLYFFCLLASPAVFLIFSLPARALGRFKATKKLAESLPFNFAKGPFSLAGDLYDRFGAPIELRFSREELSKLLENSGFSDIQFTKLKATAGLVAWASKI